MLILILLNRQNDAKALVAHLSVWSDTPLYYFSQAAFKLAEGKRMEAANCLRSAQNIFSRGISLTPYQRALELSGLSETNSPH